MGLVFQYRANAAPAPIRIDGSWAYTPDANNASTASMTCAGISSLIITGLKRFQGQEYLSGSKIENCGKGRGALYADIRFESSRSFGWQANDKARQGTGDQAEWPPFQINRPSRRVRAGSRRQTLPEGTRVTFDWIRD